MSADRPKKQLFESLPEGIQRYITLYKLDKADSDEAAAKKYWEALSIEDQSQLMKEYTDRIAYYYSSFPTDITGLILGYTVDPDDKETVFDDTTGYSLAPCALFGNTNKLAVIVLLQHVVRGEQDQVEAMLKKNPFLLLETGIVEDYSFGLNRNNHRRSKGTPLQLALAHDDDEMAAMITSYFNKLPNGEELKQKQIAERFPAGWEEKEKARNKADLDALNKVFKAIADAKEGDNYEEALTEFREYLEPKGVITTGKVFNPELFQRAFELYDANYHRFGGGMAGVNSPKNNLLWKYVMGYIQRFFPACYAQALSQGIYHLFEIDKKLCRSFKFRFKSEVSFFPLDSNPLFRLGYTVEPGVVEDARLSVPGGADTGWLGFLRCARFQELYQAKKAALENIIQPPTSLCSVM